MSTEWVCAALLDLIGEDRGRMLQAAFSSLELRLQEFEIWNENQHRMHEEFCARMSSDPVSTNDDLSFW